jgi:xylulokinase
MQKHTLGIDLGTSGLRALLVATDGCVIGSAEAHYSVFLPQEPGKEGYSEQNPHDWIKACIVALQELYHKFREAYVTIGAIGVAGHMHGACCLDKAGQVLRPCILWNDTRSHAEAAVLDATAQVRELSGNIVFPGFTAPKLMWMQKHEPDLFYQIDKVLLPAAFLTHWLTGTAVADMSDSAGTSWLDTGKRDWSAPLLAASNMTQGMMPKLVEGCAPAGTLTQERAKLLHLDANVVVVGGAGDNAAAACGIGACNDGDGFVSLGTSGVILTACESYSPLPSSAVHTFCHAIPNRWIQMGVILSCTDSLEWLGTITGKTVATMSAMLEGTPLNG